MIKYTVLTMTTILTSLITMLLAAFGSTDAFVSLNAILSDLWVNIEFVINCVCLLLYSSPYDKTYHCLCYICHLYPQRKIIQRIFKDSPQINRQKSDENIDSQIDSATIQK